MRVKPFNFFRDNVRHIHLNPLPSHWSTEEVHELLRLCPNLVSLYVVFHWQNAELLPILEKMAHVRRWSGNPGDLFGSCSSIDLSHPFFRTITHIDILESVNERKSPYICPWLAALPALTHLGLYNDVPADIWRRLLDQCSQLRILLNFWYEDSVSAHQTASSPPVTDMRYVVTACAYFVDDWEVWARGGTGIWAVADVFVARKRSGEIEGTSLLYSIFFWSETCVISVILLARALLRHASGSLILVHSIGSWRTNSPTRRVMNKVVGDSDN